MNIVEINEVVNEVKTLHITKDHTGKMSGLWSLSTSPIFNPHCIKRAKVKGSICSKCFARTMVARFGGDNGNFNKALIRNTEIITGGILTPAQIPNTAGVEYFRFEAFGDLMSETQVYNYCLIARNNPSTCFALWTKNPQYINIAIEKYGEIIPDNLSIVYSSCNINEVQKYPDEYLKYCNHLFTVYDTKGIKEGNIYINCGARDCHGCNLCYHKDTDFYINEKLK